jgi:hypothetical protein
MCGAIPTVTPATIGRSEEDQMTDETQASLETMAPLLDAMTGQDGPETPTTKALTVIRSALPTIIGADENDLLGKLADKVRSFQPDISTKKGQDAIRSMAAEVASTKMDLIRLGKRLTEDWRKQTKAVNAECAIIEERMDALKTQVRQPLTDLENAEKARIAANEAAIASIRSLVDQAGDLTSDGIRGLALESLPKLFEFGWSLEFTALAAKTRDEVLAALRQRHATAKAQEDAAAAERQRIAELAEASRVQEHRTRIADIRRFAAPSDDTPDSTYYRVKLDRLDRLPDRDWQEFTEEATEALRETRAILVTGLDEATAAEDRAREAREQAAAEAARRAAEERAEQQRQADAKAAQAALEAAAERERLAKEQLERHRAEEQERAVKAREAAIEAERKRAAQERVEADRQADMLAANMAHRGRIHREVMADILKVTTADAAHVHPDFEATVKAIVTALAKGEIRHARISYSE